MKLRSLILFLSMFVAACGGQDELRIVPEDQPYNRWPPEAAVPEVIHPPDSGEVDAGAFMPDAGTLPNNGCCKNARCVHSRR